MTPHMNPFKPFDHARAQAEGWDLFNVDGRVQLQRNGYPLNYSEDSVFQSDVDALIYVADRSARTVGWSFHRDALMRIGHVVAGALPEPPPKPEIHLLTKKYGITAPYYNDGTYRAEDGDTGSRLIVGAMFEPVAKVFSEAEARLFQRAPKMLLLLEDFVRLLNGNNQHTRAYLVYQVEMKAKAILKSLEIK